MPSFSQPNPDCKLNEDRSQPQCDNPFSPVEVQCDVTDENSASKIRRKRSHRLRQTTGNPNTQMTRNGKLQHSMQTMQATPVVTLTLDSSKSSKKGMEAADAGQVSPRIAANDQEYSIQAFSSRLPPEANSQLQNTIEKPSSEAALCSHRQGGQCSSSVSFAVAHQTGAETCQGGMMIQPNMMDHQAEGIEIRVADTHDNSGPDGEAFLGQLFAEYCNEEQDAKLTQKKENDGVAPMIFYPSDPNAVECEPIFGGSFDDILERRDYETSPLLTACDIDNPKEVYKNQVADDNNIRLELFSQGNDDHSATDKPYSQQAINAKKAMKSRRCTGIDVNQKSKNGNGIVSLISKSRSANRGEKKVVNGTTINATKFMSAFSSKKGSRNSCTSPTGMISAPALIGRESALQRKTLSTFANNNRKTPIVVVPQNGNTRNRSRLELGMQGSINTREFELTMNNERRSRQNRAQIPAIMTMNITKSHSQMPTSNSSRANLRQHHQKQLFQVLNSGSAATNSTLLTPKKPREDTTPQQISSKTLRKQKSTDYYSNCDTVSQRGCLQKSPGARSGISGGNNGLQVKQPSMYVLKSTKKLTMFKEFSITPSIKEGNFTTSRGFISPFKLQKLERKHGVQLLGDQEVYQETIGEIAPEEPNNEHIEKNQALLKDNAAMDAYMRDLCDKYL